MRYLVDWIMISNTACLDFSRFFKSALLIIAIFSKTNHNIYEQITLQGGAMFMELGNMMENDVNYVTLDF